MKKLFKKLKKSPINYFSDLFIVVMVLAWVVSIPIVMAFAIYAEIFLQDTSMWGNVVELVSIPLTAGGAIWMVKNSVQHAIANKQGKKCEYDFPSVNADGQDDGLEEAFSNENQENL